MNVELDEYMSARGYTDESFGERIGKSRIQVFRYRHGLAVPRPSAMRVIVKETEGLVHQKSFYTSTGHQ